MSKDDVGYLPEKDEPCPDCGLNHCICNIEDDNADEEDHEEDPTDEDYEDGL